MADAAVSGLHDEVNLSCDFSGGCLNRLTMRMNMARSKKSPPMAASEVHLTEFEVSDSGTLRMANYVEAETRADFYIDVADFWSRSPHDLADAMEGCQPLAWAVHSIYAAFRDELEADLRAAQGAGRRHAQRLTALKARLATLPTDPLDGAKDWLLALSASEFKSRIVPEIRKWFAEPPDWRFEGDHLPESGTAQGAAVQFFNSMSVDDLEKLGVEVVEGEHPGSTYYAAELLGDIEEANRVAEEAGIPVRFVAKKD